MIYCRFCRNRPVELRCKDLAECAFTEFPAARAQRNVEVVVLREGGDPVWRVVWDGQFTTPCFNSKGAAAAYVDMLARGRRRPEFAQ